MHVIKMLNNRKEKKSKRFRDNPEQWVPFLDGGFIQNPTKGKKCLVKPMRSTSFVAK